MRIAAIGLGLVAFLMMFSSAQQLGFSQGCGDIYGDLYMLPACAITPSRDLIDRALLTYASGTQTITADRGTSVTFAVGYTIWQGQNPSELDELMLIASWTPTWPPQPGYYWGVYIGVPPGYPGQSGSATLTFTMPNNPACDYSSPCHYYLWFVFDAHYSYEQAAGDFRTPLGWVGHIRFDVVPELSELAGIGALVIVVAFGAFTYKRRRSRSNGTLSTQPE